MPGADAIRLDGLVVEVLPNSLFRVELENRHRVLAHAARRDRDKVAGLTAGSRVRLELTPFDMSCGRIMF
jgi:translation initiation factor IF-1